MNEMNETNETKTMGLRLPVQAAVDRTAMGATLADGVGVEASSIMGTLTAIGTWIKDHITGDTHSIGVTGKF
jgi:hypothetical protein